MALPSILPPFRRDPQSSDDSFTRLQKEIDRVFESFAQNLPVPSTRRDGMFALGRFAPCPASLKTTSRFR